MRISDWSADVCSSDLLARADSYSGLNCSATLQIVSRSVSFSGAAALCAIAEELTQAPSSAAEQHDHNVLRVSNILRPRENTDKDGRMMCGSDSPRRRLSRASSRSLHYGQAGPRLYLERPAARNDAPIGAPIYGSGATHYVPRLEDRLIPRR